MSSPLVRLGIAVALVGLVPSLAGAADDPTARPLRELRAAVEALGTPAAGEVFSERKELDDYLAAFDKRARDLRDERDGLEGETKKLDRLSRERDDKLRQIDFEQKVHDADHATWLPKSRAMIEEHTRFLAAKAVATTEEEAKRINEWSDDATRRLAPLAAEEKRLKGIQDDLERRRAEIASDVIGHASRSAWLGRLRLQCDHRTVALLYEIGAARKKAFVLAQISGAPARTIDFRPPSEIAKTALLGVYTGIAKEGALAGLEGKTMLKVFARVGLKGEAAAATAGAYTVADTLLELGSAGADPRGAEITKDLLLVGDYGAAMKTIVRARGAQAMNDTAWLAMKAEVEEITASMPRSTGEALLHAFVSSAALGEAFRSVVAQYVSGVVGKAAVGIPARLDAGFRKELGEAGQAFLGTVFSVLGKPPAEEAVKAAAKAAQEQVSAAEAARRTR